MVINPISRGLIYPLIRFPYQKVGCVYPQQNNPGVYVRSPAPLWCLRWCLQDRYQFQNPRPAKCWSPDFIDGWGFYRFTVLPPPHFFQGCRNLAGVFILFMFFRFWTWFGVPFFDNSNHVVFRKSLYILYWSYHRFYTTSNPDNIYDLIR